MSGTDVRRLQQRLSNLGYWLGEPDGTYGELTTQAVMALQGVAGIGVDGVAGPQTRKAIRDGVRPTPRTSSGDAIEIDLQAQVVMVVTGGTLDYTFHTSTGSGEPYTSEGNTYIATTPTGTFAIERSIDGMRTSKLGQLWRPRYFYSGYALHGSGSIPSYPASHGCVRLTNAAIDFVWSAELAPMGRTVLVY